MKNNNNNNFFSSVEIIFYRFGWKPTAKEKNLILLDGKLIKKMEAIFKVTEEAFLYWQCETHCWKIWVTINLILAVGFGSSKRSAGKFLHNSPFWLYKLANQMVFLAMRALTSNEFTLQFFLQFLFLYKYGKTLKQNKMSLCLLLFSVTSKYILQRKFPQIFIVSQYILIAMFGFSWVQVGMVHELKELGIPKRRKEYIQTTTTS